MRTSIADIYTNEIVHAFNLAILLLCTKLNARFSIILILSYNTTSAAATSYPRCPASNVFCARKKKDADLKNLKRKRIEKKSRKSCAQGKRAV